MEAEKIGKLIYQLRTERKLTQKQLAEQLSISDRTVSKWERGAGIPDIALVGDISAVFGVDMEKLLAGDLEEQEKNGGNMKRIQFFVCEHCGSVYWGTGKGEFTCCGRKVPSLVAKKTEAEDMPHVEQMDGELYVTFSHEMTKEHHISFVALASFDRATVIKLYPEQDAAVRIPLQRRGDIYFHCTKHGLFQSKIQ